MAQKGEKPQTGYNILESGVNYGVNWVDHWGTLASLFLSLSPLAGQIIQPGRIQKDHVIIFLQGTSLACSFLGTNGKRGLGEVVISIWSINIYCSPCFL